MWIAFAYIVKAVNDIIYVFETPIGGIIMIIAMDIWIYKNIWIDEEEDADF